MGRHDPEERLNRIEKWKLQGQQREETERNLGLKICHFSKEEACCPRYAMEKQGLGIILHSGSYDRICHGLSLALAASALGREVRVLLTYWALEYFKRDALGERLFDHESESHRAAIERNIERGHMAELPELVRQAKEMGARFYACTSSMGLLNIARNELVEAVDKSMGLTGFLTETADDQLLFI